MTDTPTEKPAEWLIEVTSPEGRMLSIVVVTDKIEDEKPPAAGPRATTIGLFAASLIDELLDA